MVKIAKPAKVIKLNKMSDDDLQKLAEEKFNKLRSGAEQSEIKAK